MRIVPKNVRRFQEGGAMDAAPMEGGAPAGAEAPEQGGAPQEQGAGQQQDPVQALIQMSMQALQNQDCQMAMQVCQVFVQMAQQQMGGAPQEEPTYARYGGRLVRIR